MPGYDDPNIRFEHIQQLLKQRIPRLKEVSDLLGMDSVDVMNVFLDELESAARESGEQTDIKSVMERAKAKILSKRKPE